MESAARITGHDDLVMTTEGTIASTDLDGYNAFMRQYNSRLSEINRVTALEKRIEEQDKKLDQILALLSTK